MSGPEYAVVISFRCQPNGAGNRDVIERGLRRGLLDYLQMGYRRFEGLDVDVWPVGAAGCVGDRPSDSEEVPVIEIIGLGGHNFRPFRVWPADVCPRIILTRQIRWRRP